jgi:hypothetical protein
MFDRGRPRGAHKSSAVVLNTALQGSAEQDTALDDERMDGNPVRPRTRTSHEAASLLTQPVDGSATKADFPDDGHIEDVEPDAGPAISLSHTAMETSIPFGGPFQESPGQTGMEGIVPQTLVVSTTLVDESPCFRNRSCCWSISDATDQQALTEP